MERALTLARRGLDEGELPIGSLVALDGEVVAEAYWRGEQDRGVLRHPELVALLDADELIGSRRRDALLYTTLEPCLMCMGTAMSFFLGTIVYALDAPPDGATAVCEVWSPPGGHPQPGTPGSYRIPDVVAGVGREEAEALVREYLASEASGPFARWAAGLVRAAG